MAERQWSECSHKRGVFAGILAGLAAEHGEETTVMIDGEAGGAMGPSPRPNDLKAYCAASSLGVKKWDVDA